ncbi:hypothetical protein [Hydrocarboniclastica marina]|uniref:hypothetical protein n=1 Tax=Hydrocarboniclastica marina TaxID=2259620 RepID=UPI001561C7E3|nr:hypothetical protein [Hydrocarboniclastica marina]
MARTLRSQNGGRQVFGCRLARTTGDSHEPDILQTPGMSFRRRETQVMCGFPQDGEGVPLEVTSCTAHHYG